MKRKHNLKLPNGFGSIIYLGDNRRKPYGVYKTIGWDTNGKQIKKYIGYADTYNSAYQMLLEYNNMPYNLNYKNITLENIFELLDNKLKKEVEENKTSKSNYNALISTWNQHLSKLSDKKIVEIKRKDIQKLIIDSNLKYTGRNYIKILFSKIVDYAINELEININSDICKFDIGMKEKSNKHKPFTTEEINVIKELTLYNDFAKIVMIYLYTGLRPSELLCIKRENVFLDQDYMIGGLKTKAGIDRIIPIHSKIKSYIEELYNQENEYLVTNTYTNTKMSYDTFQKRFNKLMSENNLDHKGHDMRHTFATKCDEAGITDINIKILMGHSLAGDITNDVYIHKTVSRLKKEIEKIIY